MRPLSTETHTKRRILVGADENGMGPILGPLVVTAVTADVSEAGARIVAKPGRQFEKSIGDSKGLVSFGDGDLGEAWARALCSREHEEVVASPDELLHRLFLDSKDYLRAPCPSHHHEMCWNDSGETFSSDDALVAACDKVLAKLEAKGISIRFARSIVVCNQRLNEEARKGVSRFEMDLHAMERLILHARSATGELVQATCGKVGGFGYYGDKFGPLGGHLHAVIQEDRAKSAYSFPGVGQIAFVRDADEQDLLVGLASLVGKWVRDALMLRIVRHFRQHDEELPLASGYHDPVTSRFIDATKLVRKRTKIDPKCFLRESAASKKTQKRTTSSVPLAKH